MGYFTKYLITIDEVNFCFNMPRYLIKIFGYQRVYETSLNIY